MLRLFENKDCMEGMKQYPDKFFDLAIVDPPYGIIACEEMGFEYVGFELDPDYYAAATKRIEQYRSQLKLFI